MSLPHPDPHVEHSASDLEHRASDLRADIDMTLDELEARFTPKHLRQAVTARVRRNGVGLTLMAIRMARRRPKVVAAAAIALAAGALVRYWNGGTRR
jgi:hypothetical protein